MSTIKTTNITHGSNSGTANVVLDSSGNATCANNLTISNDATCSNNLSVTNDLSVDNDLKIDAGFGSTTTVYGCRAWIQFSQTGTQSIAASGGVSSITDDGTGCTTVTFTTAMPDNDWAGVGGAKQSTTSGKNYNFSLCFQSYGTASAYLIYRPAANSDTKQDNGNINCAFFR